MTLPVPMFEKFVSGLKEFASLGWKTLNDTFNELRCLRRLSEDASRVWYLGLNCTFGRTHDRSASGGKHLDRLTRHLVRSDALPDRRDI